MKRNGFDISNETPLDSDKIAGHTVHAKCQTEILVRKQFVRSLCPSGRACSGASKTPGPLTVSGRFHLSGALSFGCTRHLISSLTAVSCGGFLDFPVTGKLGEIPGTRAERTMRRDCKSAPAKIYTHSIKHWTPQRTQETVNRCQNLYKSQRKSCFLKNLRNGSFLNQTLTKCKRNYYEQDRTSIQYALEL